MMKRTGGPCSPKVRYASRGPVCENDELNAQPPSPPALAPALALALTLTLTLTLALALPAQLAL